jgi:cytochrome c553
MTAFQEGDRENDHYSRMRFIASQLTEDEIQGLAAYYGAPPSEEEETE